VKSCSYLYDQSRRVLVDKDWKFWLLLIIFSLYLWNEIRNRKKVFYSIEEFEKFPLKTYPIRDIVENKTLPWFFPAWRYNYHYDIPFLIEVTGFRQNENQVIKKRFWKLAPKTSDVEILSVLENKIEKKIKPDLIANKVINEEEQMKVIEEFSIWFINLNKESREIHSHDSMQLFLNTLTNTPNRYALDVIESNDYSTIKSRQIKRIKEEFNERQGIKIYLHYRSRWSPFYLVFLIKSILTSES
jgi:hypothetical protein